MPITRDPNGLTAGQRAHADGQVGAPMAVAGTVAGWEPGDEPGTIRVLVDVVDDGGRVSFVQTPPLSESERRVEDDERAAEQAAEDRRRAEEAEEAARTAAQAAQEQRAATEARLVELVDQRARELLASAGIDLPEQ